VIEGNGQTLAFRSLSAASGDSHRVMDLDCKGILGMHQYRSFGFQYHAQQGSFYVQDGATEIPNSQPLLSVEDLADQVAEVLDFKYAHAALVVYL
jgi:hypothetical protein